MKNTLLPLLVFLSFFLSCNTQNNDQEVSENALLDSALELPEGFKAYVVAESLGNGRHIAVNDNGDIYVSLRSINNGGGIVALRDTNNDVRADIVEYFSDYPGTGIGLHKDHLYLGSDLEVMRYPLQDGNLLPDLNPEIIATGFPDQNQHAVKPFTFEGAYPSGDWEIFADNFDRVDEVMSPGDAVYRPCGVAEGPDGSLYVVDSKEGKVWNIRYEE